MLAPAQNAPNAVEVPKNPQDQYVRDLMVRLKAVIPYRGNRKVAHQLKMSTSHLKQILEGKSDVGSVFRARIEEYLAKHGALATSATKAVLDSANQRTETMTSPVPLPPVSSPSEVKLVPSPSHAAYCELLSRLPETAVLQMMHDLIAKVEAQLAREEVAPPQPQQQVNHRE